MQVGKLGNPPPCAGEVSVFDRTTTGPTPGHGSPLPQAGKHSATSQTAGRPILPYWGPVQLGRRRWGTRLRGQPRRTGPVTGTHVVEARVGHEEEWPGDGHWGFRDRYGGTHGTGLAVESWFPDTLRAKGTLVWTIPRL